MTPTSSERKGTAASASIQGARIGPIGFTINVPVSSDSQSVGVKPEPKIDDSRSSGITWEARDSKLLRNYFELCAKYDEFFERQDDWSEAEIRDYLINSGLAHPRSDAGTCLTHAGVIFCCKRTHILRDIFHIHVKFQQMSDAGSLSEELFGSVLFLYRELHQRLAPIFKRRMGSPDIRDESGGESVFFEYPETAIVEALVNFLIHRDYSLDDIGFITIYADRVEFMNPGQSEIPPEELVTAEVPFRPLYRRNPRLIEAMNKARLNQREGSGILRIRRELERNGSYLKDGSLGLSVKNDEVRNRFVLTLWKRDHYGGSGLKGSLGRVLPDSGVYAAEPPFAMAKHQLPAPVKDFVGRQSEISALVDSLHSESASIVCISGMGGIGKTQLALVIANELRQDHPDAQLFIDLRGTESIPRSPANALVACIRAFVEPGAKMPESVEELSNLYRSILSGKRVLVVLDNAADSVQIQPMLPPQGCALIITSRNTLAVAGMARITLDLMQPNEARQLFLSIVPQANPSIADEICSLCGYLPLAIRSAGALLAVTPDLEPPIYLSRLRDERVRLESLGEEGVERSVKASFHLSYAQLPFNTARVFRDLTVFAGSFDAPAEEVVCEDEGNVHLAELVRRSLVLYDRKLKRYQLHDLVRAFLLAHLSDAEGNETASRHASHYSEIIRAANEAYKAGGEALLHGLSVFDLEWPNIQAGQRWTESSRGLRADELCSAYSSAYDVLNLRVHPGERIHWLNSALAAARRQGDRKAEGTHLGNLGLTSLILGKTNDSIGLNQQYLLISREMGDKGGESKALNNIGLACQALGDMSRANENYEQSLRIARETGDRSTEGNALANIGTAYLTAKKYPKAVECNNTAVAVFQELGDRRGEAAALCNLGLAHLGLNKLSEASGLEERSLAISRDIGDKRGESRALNNLGLVYAALGEPNHALQCYEESLKIAREIGDRRLEGRTLGNVASAYLDLNETKHAIDHYEQRYLIARETADRRGELNALSNLALAHLRQGQTSLAIEYYEKYLLIADEENCSAREISVVKANLKRLKQADYFGLGKRGNGQNSLPDHKH